MGMLQTVTILYVDQTRRALVIDCSCYGALHIIVSVIIIVIIVVCCGGDVTVGVSMNRGFGRTALCACPPMSLTPASTSA